MDPVVVLGESRRESQFCFNTTTHAETWNLVSSDPGHVQGPVAMAGWWYVWLNLAFA